ncbi:hypothetical protein [Streptomonospora wellingtoniae]|uniref:Trp biosynthesis-associated membrane protein n=1 Tax=Streptomonospora wellingtoniae TaxID=3075544 RepID=A0ABU2KZQ4_9ACTN|nr:hypothetical protein [Streptomonospora sp. DSM 45055]MDT0304573.1 hypothetical protein [Streptomonospora sp. DSM 45055]
MSNGLRHTLGLFAAVLVAPVLAAGLAWAPHWTAGAGVDYDLAAVPGVPSWAAPVGVLAVVGLLLGLVTGSRLSPLAALLPGLALVAAGVVETAGLPQPVPALEDVVTVEGAGSRPWFPWGPMFVLAGAMLVVSALPPSRWRRRVREDEDYDDDYGGYEDRYAGYSSAEPAGSGDTPPTGAESTQTMSWDADGMPPRYHVSDPRDPQAPQPGATGWNEPRPRRWEDRGTGP